MEVVIDFRNYAPWYNTVVLLLLSGTTVMVWAWTIHGLASLVRGPHPSWEKTVRGVIFAGTALIVLVWVFYSLMLTSHHLVGWPNIHSGDAIQLQVTI